MARRTLLLFTAAWLAWLVLAWLVAFGADTEWIFWAMLAVGLLYSVVLVRKRFR